MWKLALSLCCLNGKLKFYKKVYTSSHSILKITDVGLQETSDIREEETILRITE